MYKVEPGCYDDPAQLLKDMAASEGMNLGRGMVQ